MGILTNQQNSAAGMLRTAFLAAGCMANLFLLGFFIHRQAHIERMGLSAPAPANAAPAAKLLSKSGRVLVFRSGALGQQELSAGGALYPGDRVQTMRGASAVLLLGNATRMSLGENALLIAPDPEKDRRISGSVLRVTKGNFKIDSETLSDDVVAIQTNNAMIKLRVRDVVVFRPRGGSAADTGMAYLEFLEQLYFNADGSVKPPRRILESAQQAVERAARACRHESASCAAAQDKAWRALNALHAKIQKEQKVSISLNIDSKGADNIKVTGGNVQIETGSRTLTLSKGDRLKLKPGVVPTQSNLSENAAQQIAPPEPKPEQTESAETAAPQTPPKPALSFQAPHAAPRKPRPRPQPAVKIESMNWQ